MSAYKKREFPLSCQNGRSYSDQEQNVFQINRLKSRRTESFDVFFNTLEIFLYIQYIFCRFLGLEVHQYYEKHKKMNILNISVLCFCCVQLLQSTASIITLKDNYLDFFIVCDKLQCKIDPPCCRNRLKANAIS